MFKATLHLVFVIGTIAFFLNSEAIAAASNSESIVTSADSIDGLETELSKFKPDPSRNVKLDFERMDLILQRGVLFTGQSLRVRARRPQPFTGTRFVKKHTSPYRLEGNKIAYSLFDNKQKKLISEYLEELQILSQELDISKLPRNDQLAYWFNLHNLGLMHEVSKRYPVKYPKDIIPIRGQADTLHDAKIFDVNGTKLSLRDIREKIVYRHWRDPMVIYGFHDGTLGAPAIPAIAFERGNVRRLLAENAREFTNSLRGYENGKISSFYREVAPFFFPQFDADIREHFQRFMRPEVFSEVQSVDKFSFHRDIDIIADLTGGYGNRVSISPLLINGSDSGASLPAGAVEFIEARRRKIIKLREQGLLTTGTVIIEDIETDPNQPID